MRALAGISLELLSLVLITSVAAATVSWYPFSILVLLLAQLLTTVLVHCPAHYMVGRLLGIRFVKVRLGRSTAVSALPRPLKRVGRLLVVFTLSVDKESRKSAAPERLRAMFLAGVVGSAASAILFASAVTLTGNYIAASVTWLFAIAYLASDVVFSPKAGDLKRARAAMVKP